MKITFDPAKRNWTLLERGLDFDRCPEVFQGNEITTEDKRTDYGERRWATIGFLDDRMVIVIWTERGDARRIISLRKANEREQARYGGTLGSPDVA